MATKTILERAVADLGAAPSIDIHGKAYTQVATRVEVFRRHFGTEYGLVTEVLTSPAPNLVRVRASITHGDNEIASGMAEEDRTKGNINKTSALENCETSAVGRALAAFGLHGGEYATAGEVQNAIHQQNQPDWKGPLNKTELKKQSRDFAAKLGKCVTPEAVEDLIAGCQGMLDQLAIDLPEWYFGDGNDIQGAEMAIQGARERVEAPSPQKAEEAPSGQNSGLTDPIEIAVPVAGDEPDWKQWCATFSDCIKSGDPEGWWKANQGQLKNLEVARPDWHEALVKRVEDAKNASD